MIISIKIKQHEKFVFTRIEQINQNCTIIFKNEKIIFFVRRNYYIKKFYLYISISFIFIPHIVYVTSCYVFIINADKFDITINKRVDKIPISRYIMYLYKNFLFLSQFFFFFKDLQILIDFLIKYFA